MPETSLSNILIEKARTLPLEDTIKLKKKLAGEATLLERAYCESCQDYHPKGSEYCPLCKEKLVPKFYQIVKGRIIEPETESTFLSPPVKEQLEYLLEAHKLKTSNPAVLEEMASFLGIPKQKESGQKNLVKKYQCTKCGLEQYSYPTEVCSCGGDNWKAVEREVSPEEDKSLYSDASAIILPRKPTLSETMETMPRLYEKYKYPYLHRAVKGIKCDKCQKPIPSGELYMPEYKHEWPEEKPWLGHKSWEASLSDQEKHPEWFSANPEYVPNPVVGDICLECAGEITDKDIGLIVSGKADKVKHKVWHLKQGDKTYYTTVSPMFEVKKEEDTKRDILSALEITEEAEETDEELAKRVIYKLKHPPCPQCKKEASLYKSSKTLNYFECPWCRHEFEKPRSRSAYSPRPETKVIKLPQARQLK